MDSSAAGMFKSYLSAHKPVFFQKIFFLLQKNSNPQKPPGPPHPIHTLSITSVFTSGVCPPFSLRLSRASSFPQVGGAYLSRSPPFPQGLRPLSSLFFLHIPISRKLSRIGVDQNSFFWPILWRHVCEVPTNYSLLRLQDHQIILIYPPPTDHSGKTNQSTPNICAWTHHLNNVSFFLAGNFYKKNFLKNDFLRVLGEGGWNLL